MSAVVTTTPAMIDMNRPMRVGRKLGRTLYLVDGRGWQFDLCVGLVDSAELAAEIVARWNAGGAA